MTEIVILGDICPRWGNAKQFETNDPQEVFHDILPILGKANFVVANMESPLTECNCSLQKTSMNLKALPGDARVLKEAGIKALSLANNHILDFGKEGLNDTFDTLKNNDILFYGAGTPEESKQALFVEFEDIKVGFLSFAEHEFNCAVDYGIGACLWDDLDSICSIRQAKQQCDFLVVQYHGGVEHYIYPSPLLQKKCRAMADAGADFVTCQHSHCVGTREEWNSSEILYGQGNSIFGFNSQQDSNQGLVVKISFNKTMKDITYLPIESRENGEYLMGKAEAVEFLEQFENRSRKISGSEFVANEWKAFCSRQRDSYLALLIGWNRILNKANRLLGGVLLKFRLKTSSKRAMMNIVRCDAHREVVQTILEEDLY